MGVNKVIYNGKILIDLSITTVTPETLAAGRTAYDAAGNLIAGIGVLMERQGNAPQINYTKVYNKIIYNGRTLIDLTACTVTPETLAAGVTAYNSAGSLITGVGAFADRLEADVYSGVAIYEFTKERHELLSKN